MKEYQIAFAGNPNVGKSAWINALSDAHFKVGNWPGVTVEKKEAIVSWEGNHYHLIDLPGTYALSEKENEEGIAADYLTTQPIDLIVNVVDATNLARNLYLTLRLRQLQLPMIVIFNFMDEVARYHMEIDIKAIRDQLGLPIYPYSAFDEAGKQAVMQGICRYAAKTVYYPPCIAQKDEQRYRRILDEIKRKVPAYVKLQEKEQELFAYALMFRQSDALRQLSAWDMDLHELVPSDDLPQDEDLYLFQQVEEIMHYVVDDESRLKHTGRMDRILLHPLWGKVCMAAILSLFMLVVFQSSAPLNDFIDFLIHDMVMKYVNALLFFLPDAAKSLVLNGVIAGVGGVLVFVPLMLFLHIALSFLEESGYMARIAYLLDHGMQHFHLNGKSFVALLLGFGCNVPAVYATRTLSNEKQRRMGALLVPFMSCGARLPVYMLFAAAFFQGKAAMMILSIYGIGILIALLIALILSRVSAFRDDEIMVMELPPYRLPSLHVIMHKAALEVQNYVRKATSVVLWAMVILWGLTYLPNGTVQDSYLAQLAKTTAPLYEPLGFGDRWECVAALPGGIIAKETVVGFMDQVLLQEESTKMERIDPWNDLGDIAYAFGSALKGFSVSLIPHRLSEAPRDTLIAAIRSLWTDDQANVRAYSYMVYILLSIPCIMTLQALRKEYGWKLMGISLGMMIVIPYVTSLMIFQLFSLLI